MTLMCVHRVVEPLYQVMTGHIPALECMLLGACGSKWLCLVCHLMTMLFEDADSWVAGSGLEILRRGSWVGANLGQQKG
jgi:hypothetical protein